MFVTACARNDAVHSVLLNQIYGWVTAGATLDDVIERLRLKTVPTGYSIHNLTRDIYNLKFCIFEIVC